MNRLVALALALAAAPAAAGVRPAHGGGLRVAVPALPSTLDPAHAVEPQDLLAARATSGALLEVDGAGRLSPGLLAEVPVPEAGGRAFRLRLRADLRTWDDRPVFAADVAAALTRLATPATASPHAWAVLPILGAEALLAGRASTLAGLQVLSERELLVTLERPLPSFAHALAAAPLALPGTGPFRPAAPAGGALVLPANPRCARGAPFLSSLTLVASADARAAARLLERGEVELVLRPEPAGGRAGPAFPALIVVVAALQPARLGAGAEAVRSAIAALDRADLARRRARGAAVPLATLVPPSLLEAPLPAASPASGRPPPRVGLLVPEGAPDARAAAERIQVRLFDLGVRAAVEVEPRARYAARLAGGAYDVALVSVPVLAAEPALAAAQVAFAVRGPAGARAALEALSGAEPAGAAQAALALGPRLDLVPLFAVAPRASLGPEARGLVPRADGGFDPGELWSLGGGAP